MKKSIVLKEYALFTAFLRKARQDAKISQIQLAKKLKTTQSFVSKTERAERRLDIIELRQWCRGLGLSLPEFVSQMEQFLKANKSKPDSSEKVSDSKN